jgi:hypothetical protein
MRAGDRLGGVRAPLRFGRPPRTVTDEPPGSQLQVLGWSQNGTRIFYTAGV